MLKRMLPTLRVFPGRSPTPSHTVYYSFSMDTPRPGKTRVTSVSLRAETLEAIRARAGKQGVSSYIEEAVQRQLQREAIDEYIEAAESDHGPVDPAEAAAKAERIRAHHAAHRGGSTPANAA
ncbi:hypothetical protein [Kitasatospora sp. NBC_01539]|uniref:hypothetical protein n=1 Tax=Kitasatospora sp. NBC_01539 TaxID=2903577 RepID=UPI0038602D91